MRLRRFEPSIFKFVNLTLYPFKLPSYNLSFGPSGLEPLHDKAQNLLHLPFGYGQFKHLKKSILRIKGT